MYIEYIYMSRRTCSTVRMAQPQIHLRIYIIPVLIYRDLVLDITHICRRTCSTIRKATVLERTYLPSTSCAHLYRRPSLQSYIYAIYLGERALQYGRQQYPNGNIVHPIPTRICLGEHSVQYARRRQFPNGHTVYPIPAPKYLEWHSSLYWYI